MSKINTGGPAFPQPAGVAADGTTFFEGMTLRDYFAAKTMQSCLAGDDRGKFTIGEWAKTSYQMADAMLKARDA